MPLPPALLAPCPQSDAPGWDTYAGEGQEQAHGHQHGRGHSAVLIDVADAVIGAVEAALVRLYWRLVQHHEGQHDCAGHTQTPCPGCQHTRTDRYTYLTECSTHI